MARNSDPHPEPDDPREGPTPKFPPGAAPIRPAVPPQPGILRPGNDIPAPARDPFPDHLPDPGIGKP